MSTDDIYKLLDTVANTLRGITLDPAIPEHAKSVMQTQILKIDEALELIESESDS